MSERNITWKDFSSDSQDLESFKKLKNIEYEKLLNDFGSLKVQKDKLEIELRKYKTQTMECVTCETKTSISDLVTKNFLNGLKLQHCPNCKKG